MLLAGLWNTVPTCDGAENDYLMILHQMVSSYDHLRNRRLRPRSEASDHTELTNLAEHEKAVTDLKCDCCKVI